MITLHVYLTAKPGKESEVEATIRDSWIKAMAEQPGFLHAALLRPFSDEELDALGAMKPSHTFEVVSFWPSLLSLTKRPRPKTGSLPKHRISRREPSG